MEENLEEVPPANGGEDAREHSFSAEDLQLKAPLESANPTGTATGGGDDEESKQQPPKEEEPTEKKVAMVQLKLQFMAVGGAPILKKNKFQVRESMTVAEVLMFLRRTLKVREGDPLFLYVNSSFAPGLDQALRCLHESFQINGELVLQYAITSSWG